MTEKKKNEKSEYEKAEIELMQAAGRACAVWVGALVEEAMRGEQTDMLLEHVKDTATAIHDAKQRMLGMLGM